MRAYNILDKKASSSPVHPSLEDEKGLETTPGGIIRTKVMDFLNVGNRQKQLEVQSLRSAGCNDGHNHHEDAVDVCQNCESLVALPQKTPSANSSSMSPAHRLNASDKGKNMRLPVTSRWGVKLLDLQCLARMSVVLNNPDLCATSSSPQIHTGKGDSIAPSSCVGQERAFPLPPLCLEKHLLPSPHRSPSQQRKEELPVAHPLPQPPLLQLHLPESLRDQPLVSQVPEQKENTSCHLQSMNELSTREAVPLPSSVLENARAAQVSSLETLNQRLVAASMVPKSRSPSSSPARESPSQRLIATMVQKACCQSSSPARESPRTCHLLPIPPTEGPGLNSPTPSSSPCPPSKPLCPCKWRKGAVLGQGTFGIVYEGLNLEDGSFFAVKVSSTDDASPQVQQEVDLLSRLEHPNIVRYLGSKIEEGRLCIFLELVRMGSLEALLRKYKRFEENTIRSYTQQILHGLEYLHSQKTIHRDIKCGNILVDVNGQVKLSDFGVAKQVGETLAYSSKGTPLYMAPEVLMPRQNCYGFSADIWSLGCTVLEMADGKPPWSNLEGFGFLFKVKNGELPPMPDHLSPEGRDFVCSCLKFNAKDRPTASELLQHPFVSCVSTRDLPFTWACASMRSSVPGADNGMSVDSPSSYSMIQCTL